MFQASSAHLFYVIYIKNCVSSWYQ